MLRPMIAQTGNLRQWQYFVALAETGSFTAAAARLGVSQPPVSNAIKRLEAGVGTPLFIRGAGEVKLTEAGLTLLPYARVINRDLQTMHSMIDGIRSGAQSGFRLAISSALPSEIGSRIAAKAQQHDGVVLSSLPSVEILARVEEGAIHAGLVQAPVPLGTHRSARQFSLSRDLVVPPGYSRLDKTLSQLNLLVENLNDNSSAASGLARELFRSGVSCEINDSEDALGRGLLIGRGEGMSLVFRGFHQFDNAIELPSRFDFSVDVVVRRGGMDNGAEAMAVAERICRRINQ
ncbi:LysR family transcriptional regulator [Corynebacterium jeikeium]|nr:LysR family transcriptional regulator [Corynebacterium diphtheriae]CAB0967473.1 LysR family transcriptional regulator [Corynebacterium diphtheriae]SUY81731.1 LysR family transcriptional regulator [Corynebacterium jeikeium]SUY81735.1 LysR family transcriptional regulator [Corynebacterium jeikeium]